jgi:molybdopterin-containing oxidoreductase family membrane subunit
MLSIRSLIRIGAGVMLLLLLLSISLVSLFPILHLGRPWRFYWPTPIPKEGMLFPNFHAPLIRDFLGINALLAGVLVCLLFTKLFPMLSAGEPSPRE